jgi:hypothetical protein
MITANIRCILAKHTQATCHPKLAINQLINGGKIRPPTPPLTKIRLIARDLLRINQLFTIVVIDRNDPNEMPIPATTP